MVRRNLSLLILTFALIFVFSISFVSAAVRYVDDNTADDLSTVCSTDDKCKTIQRGIDVAAAGDTIQVASGYYESIHVNKASLTIQSSSGPSATYINGSIIINSTGSNFVLGGASGNGFTIRNSTSLSKNSFLIKIGTGVLADANATENITISYNNISIIDGIAGFNSSYSSNASFFNAVLIRANVTNLVISNNNFTFFGPAAKAGAIVSDDRIYEIKGLNVSTNTFIGYQMDSRANNFTQGIVLTVPNIASASFPTTIQSNTFQNISRAIVIGNDSLGSGIISGNSYFLIDSNKFLENNISIDILSADSITNGSLQDIRITNNNFTRNYIAIMINSSFYAGGYVSYLDPTDFNISLNDFVQNYMAINNTVLKASSDGFYFAVKAENNWWGSQQGAFRMPTMSSIVMGGNVSNYVDFSPWCSNLSGNHCATTNNTNVGGGIHTTIQAAINNASIGDIIEVANGSYAENLAINMSLTLKSLDGRETTKLTTGTITLSESADNFVLGGSSGNGFYMNASTADLIKLTGTAIKSGPENVTISFNTFNVTANNRNAIGLVGTNLSGLSVRNNTFFFNGTNQGGVISDQGRDVNTLTVVDNNFTSTRPAASSTRGIALSVPNLNTTSQINRNKFYNLSVAVIIGNNSLNAGYKLGRSGYLLIDSNMFLGSNISLAILNADTLTNTTYQDIRITSNNFTDNLVSAISINSSDFYATTTKFGFGIQPFNFTLTNNSFVGNALAINNSLAAGGNLNASHSWWGAATGPGGVGTGAGDNLTSRVIFEPWYLTGRMLTLTNTTAAATTTTTTTTTTTSGGSSAATTTVTWSKTITLNENQFTQGDTKQLGANERARFKVDGAWHQVGVKEVGTSNVKIQVSSDAQEATLNVGDVRKFELTGDNTYDLSVKLNSIVSKKADLTVKSISEEITAETIAEEAEKEAGAAGEAGAEGAEEVKTSSLKWIIVIAIIVIIAVVAAIIIKKRRK